jgi:DNA-binding transcriptional LysR family regulator
MIDFRSLSYFLVACECENLGSAARELGIAPSTLSASLKSLETSFGISLFHKQGGGLLPRRLAHWLYRAAVPVLLLEGFARRRIIAPQGATTGRIAIEVRLRFAFGQFRRALAKAIADMAEEEPLILADPEWPLEDDAAFGTVPSESLGFTENCSVVIESIVRPALPEETVLREDPWMLVRSRFEPHANDLAPDSPRIALVPAFSANVVDQIIAYGRTNGIEVRSVDSNPGDWPQLIGDNPGAALLLPSSAVGTRPGGSRAIATPLDPPIASTLVARTDGSPLADRFVEHLKRALADGSSAPVFAPMLTERRVRYFNYAYDLGRISAAARAASVAQPALSQQLHKLEESLGTSLFDRCAFGLIRTEKSILFSQTASLLDRRLREMEMSGMTASLAEGGRLSLGVLPSVSHNGHLVNRITDALLGMRERYPTMSITVREAPNGTLRNWVLRGTVGLAIVETALSQMPRLALDADEELAVIADPRHNLLPTGPVRLADLAKIPLALPTTLFGIRQLLDTAARNADVDLRPKHEIDALTMLIALLKREPIATVLPASALRPEIVHRELVAHPIIEPVINRRLFVIYSGDRSLTPAERELVKLLRQHLSQPSPGAPVALEALG